jgi:hypothetical protein
MRIKLAVVFLILLALGNLPSAARAEGISVEGSGPIVIPRESLEVLPHGRTTGSVLENWITPMVFLPVETGGLSRVDGPRFSSGGISWTEENWKVNGIDVTDPLHSGSPLFEPGWDSIEEIRIISGQTADPQRVGVDWQIGVPAFPAPFRASDHLILPVGGGALFPAGVMDREPSFPNGSHPERRRYEISNELNASYSRPERFFYGIEALWAERRFPTLVNENGRLVDEVSRKGTFSSVYRVNSRTWPAQALFLAQFNQNDNFGASLRLDRENSLNQENFLFHLQYLAGRESAAGSFRIRSGITARFEDLDPRLSGPRTVEFAPESGPVPEAGRFNRFNFDNSLTGKKGIFGFEAGLKVTGLFRRPNIPFSETREIYTGAGGDETVFLTRWDPERGLSEIITLGRLNGGIAKTWGGFSLEGNLYLDFTNAAANGGNLLNWLGAGARVLSEYRIASARTVFRLGGSHMPAKITSALVEFLDRGSPSGSEYLWLDSNGDGLAADPELVLFSTTGGRYHYQAENLSRPFQDAVFLGFEKKIGGNYSFLLQGSHRVFSGYFVVDYGSYGGYYSQDNGNRIYHKPLGADTYYLTNYTGPRGSASEVDIQVRAEWERFYLNVMFSAMYFRGFAPIGNGPDYNDYAAISEETASPNARINAVGRFDQDRAYKANILIGWRIRKNLSLGSTLKYRDGEPFSQLRIYRTHQGTYNIPVAVIDMPRGEQREGGTRYTFSWNLDLRLRYTPGFWGGKTSLVLDVYNAIGSATELLESNRVEDKRFALEAVPPRMLKLGLECNF